MGNCLRIQSSSSSSSSSMVWAGDDWGSITDIYKNSNGDVNGDEKRRLLGDYQENRPSMATGSIREVKLKITKRELEELMADAQMQGLTMEQVLAKLVNNYNYEDNYEPNHHNYYYSHHDHHHHHWKPALQSIPEVN